MIVSKKILNQWIDVHKIKDQDLAVALNSLGFEVEKVTNLVNANTNLIVGEIIKIEQHPKSKKLSLCYVNIGKKIEKIICGASNVRVGIKVVVAQVGSKLANGMIIEKREILGVISHGMICSLEELGLNREVLLEQELEGIVYLPDYAPVGSISPLSYLDLDDSIFELQLTFNRSDCLAMYYLAQELRHYFNLSLKKISLLNFKNVTHISTKAPFINALATLQITLSQKLPSNYSWLTRTLQLANIKPQNFFSDIASLVMLELGQPVATFNAADWKSLKIGYPAANSNQETLQYTKNDLVFENETVIFSNLGCQTLNSYSPTQESKSIAFVSLSLDQKLVQQQIKRYNFSSPALFLQRVNKPIVPLNYFRALQRIAFWLHYFKVHFEVIQLVDQVSFKAHEQYYLLHYEKINHLLGTKFDFQTILNVLKVINCQIITKSTRLKTIKVKVPAYRSDLKQVSDFAEEVARIIGYDNLPIVKPRHLITPLPPSSLEVLLQKLRVYLLNYGFHQVKTYSLTSQESLTNFNFFHYKKAISVEHPMNISRKVMRFSLVPSLLEICRFNSSHKQDELRIFSDEVVYTTDQDPNHHFAFVLHHDFFLEHASKAQKYLAVKGFLEAFLVAQTNQQFVGELNYQVIKAAMIHPYLSANISYNNFHFATIAFVNPQTSKDMGLHSDLCMVEINVSQLVKLISDWTSNYEVKFKNWSKFNPLKRDLSIIVDNKVTFASIENTIKSAKVKYLQHVTLIDRYQDENLQAKNKYSLTFNLEFNNKKEQLDEERISQELKAIQEILISRFKVEVR